MQMLFEAWLLDNNYKPTTAVDYPDCLRRLCAREKISYEYLAEHLSEIMVRYQKGGKEAGYAKTSHYSVWNALCRFKEFLAATNIQLPRCRW